MTLSLIVYLHYSVNHLKNLVLVDKYNYIMYIIIMTTSNVLCLV